MRLVFLVIFQATLFMIINCRTVSSNKPLVVRDAWDFIHNQIWYMWHHKTVILSAWCTAILISTTWMTSDKRIIFIESKLFWIENLEKYLENCYENLLRLTEVNHSVALEILGNAWQSSFKNVFMVAYLCFFCNYLNWLKISFQMELNFHFPRVMYALICVWPCPLAEVLLCSEMDAGLATFLQKIFSCAQFDNRGINILITVSPSHAEMSFFNAKLVVMTIYIRII